MKTARDATTAVDCPFPSCGAKVGKACNSPRGGMSVGMVEQPFVHVGRAQRAIEQDRREVVEAAAQEAFSFDIDWSVGFAENLGKVGLAIRALAPVEPTPAPWDAQDHMDMVKARAASPTLDAIYRHSHPSAQPKCQTCDGQGGWFYKTKQSMITCRDCNGTGRR